MNKRKLGFKWFGSLTNLTSRHSEKPNIKATSGRSESLTAVGGQSVDDIEPCLQSPNYAHSDEMYTHVGTIPRSQSQKKSCREMKQKKSKEEEKEKKTKSHWKAEEHVQHSPLLHALSNQSLTSLDQSLSVPAASRPLPCTPAPGRPSPLTSPADHCRKPLDHTEVLWTETDVSDTNSCVRKPSNMTKAASPQDLYVPMDPIYESACTRRGIAGKQEATEAANDSKKVNISSLKGSADTSGDYVKFSKDKFWLEPPSENLKKQLDDELRLSGTNLKSHAWYHGPVPWEVAESLVVNHGEFLIRDSRSNHGDFVLTCHWQQKTLHFLIRRTVLQSSETYTRVQYSLEEEAFDSLPALVHFYVGSKAALTQWSGAQIHRPINRTLPLSYLDTAFGTIIGTPSSHGDSLCGQPRMCHRSPASIHKGADLNRDKDETPQAAAGESFLSTPYNTPRLKSRSGSVAPSPSFSRHRSLPSPSSSLRRPQIRVNLDCPSSNSDWNGYTELYPHAHSYVERLRVERFLECDQPRVEDGDAYCLPVVEAVSSFKPSMYMSPLMAQENKPLEVGILRRVKELLSEVDHCTAAKHITKADCTVARILEVTPEVQKMMGVSSGMELLTLPHGQRLRLDLLERFQTMATTLAVEMLGCTGTTEERASLLHKMIQIAAELKSTMGNMFGFAAVMRALELPQVSRLEQTWTALRQRHTEGAILYEKTLRPFMKSLNEGRESCSLSNTTFPHVLPLLFLLEKSAAADEALEPWETVEAGVDVVMFHLGAARTFAQQGGVYRSIAETKLKGFEERAEVTELFLTDFQMRLLWGSRGAEENQALRYGKFDQVLTALSNKLEPPVRAG
ncbi:SH2 domain containing 3Cb isoform X1 [Takifugu rubripes]|uniref:SH2 domain-containing protein 3C-like n=1 Tax=Takifugu rubripes TaxID=31033 RepID=H2T3H7_TAKRU|nr:SH2 domain-containing protein 3C-like isoform X1 [Takifugu rubripes]